MHVLGGHRRSPMLLALWALPAAFVGAQLLASICAQLAVSVFGGGDAGHIAMLGAAFGGGIALLLIACLVPLSVHLSPVDALGLRRRPVRVFVAASVGTFMLGPVAELCMRAAAALFPTATEGNVGRLHDLAQSLPAWAVWPFLALLPGFCEELFFRGMFQRAFAAPRLGMWASAIAFALFHRDPHHVAGVLPLGLFLAWVGMRHGTWVTIVAHVVNNSVALWTAAVPALDVGYGTGTPMPLWWVPVGLVFVAGSIGVLLRPVHAPDSTPAGPAGQG